MSGSVYPQLTREAALGEILAEIREIRANPPDSCDAVDLENLATIEDILLRLASGAVEAAESDDTRD